MTGLKICTRWRAISARRRRRISSSLLPLNMGPQITSIQPKLPRMAFISSSPFSPSFLPSFFPARSLCDFCHRCPCQPGAGKFPEFFKRRKHLSGTTQQPAADIVDWHPADQVHRESQTMSKSQFALCAGAASGVLVPVTDNGVTLVFDQIKVIGNNFFDGLAEAPQVSGFPCAKLAGF